MTEPSVVASAATPTAAAAPTVAALPAASAEADVAALLAGLRGTPSPPGPSATEMKYRLTALLFPAILLVFVALYVTSLASGAEPEMSLLRAGGVSVVLAILARGAIAVLHEDAGQLPTDGQIAALARAGITPDRILAAADANRSGDAAHPAPAAPSAATGGKE